MTERTDAPLRRLRAARGRWVDLHVTVSKLPDGRIRVQSTHTDQRGQVVQRFQVTWSDPARESTEYGHGLSIVHDVKDHIFHGLGFTPLTEIQTIVQTYSGRELAGGESGRVEGGDYVNAIREHVFHELFGAAGRPLVYDMSEMSQTGLLELHAPSATAAEAERAFFAMCAICEGIMLPQLLEVYRSSETLRRLQASPRDQPALVEELLGEIAWSDPRRMLVRLDALLDYERRVRAYVDDELAAVSREIRDRVARHVEQEGLQRFGPIFDVRGYLLGEEGAA